MGVGVVETVRGHTIAGPIQILGGAVGAGLFGAGLRAARQELRLAPQSQLNNVAFGSHITQTNLAKHRLGVDPVEAIPRPVLTQSVNQNCGPTCCGMILRTLGYQVDQHTIDLIWNAVRSSDITGWGTRTEDIFEVYRRFVPNARFVARGKLSTQDLARAVENGHPVHLGFRHDFLGHAVIVDGVERGLTGRVLGFVVRDSSGSLFGPIGSTAAQGMTTTIDDLAWLLANSDAVLTNPSRWL